MVPILRASVILSSSQGFLQGANQRLPWRLLSKYGQYAFRPVSRAVFTSFFGLPALVPL
jgi:hypothetical protein